MKITLHEHKSGWWLGPCCRTLWRFILHISIEPWTLLATFYRQICLMPEFWGVEPVPRKAYNSYGLTLYSYPRWPPVPPSHCAWSLWWRRYQPVWLLARRAASLPGLCALLLPASHTPLYRGWQTKCPPEENTELFLCQRNNTDTIRLFSALKPKTNWHKLSIFTLLSTLSKPGLSTIALITCFKEFKVSEAIVNDKVCVFNTFSCSQCQTSVYLTPPETVACRKTVRVKL